MSWSDTRSGEQAAHSLARTFLWLLVGPVLWSMHFTVIYLAHTVLCARGFSEATSAIVIGAATVAALLVLAGFLTRSRASFGTVDTLRFERRVAAVLIFLSMVGVAWAGAATLFVPGCVSLR